MKTVFVGAVEGSLKALNALCDAGHVPEMVVTLPPELAHRHSDYADLAPVAKAHGCTLHLTRKSDSEETIAAIRAIEPDLVLVIGWSQLCGVEFRAVPKLGCIGYHPSDLPKLRAGRCCLGRFFWVSRPSAPRFSGWARARIPARLPPKRGSPSIRTRSKCASFMIGIFRPWPTCCPP